MTYKQRLQIAKSHCRRSRRPSFVCRNGLATRRKTCCTFIYICALARVIRSSAELIFAECAKMSVCVPFTQRLSNALKPLRRPPRPTHDIPLLLLLSPCIQYYCRLGLNAPARIQHLYRYHRIPTYCLKVLMRRRQCECIIICHVFTTLKLVECVYGLFDLQVQASSNLVAVLLRDTPQSCWWSETKTFRSFGPPLGQF